MDKTLYFTRRNTEKIKERLSLSTEADARDRENWAALEEKVARGSVVPPRDIRADVVTINSRVHLKDLDTSKEILITLVFPDDADIAQGKLSVLSPMGTAILGYSQGDSIKWETRSGMRRVRIVRICYQPESAGENAS